MVSLTKILLIFIALVGNKPALDLVEQCISLGMKREPFLATSVDANLPHFDKGYVFTFATDNDVQARLEILAVDEKILQAGVQIVYPTNVPSKVIDEHYSVITRVAAQHYGPPTPTELGGVSILNYGDRLTLCYVHELHMRGQTSITFRVGNRQLWE